MKEQENSAAQANSARSDVGDVETAGETTAAATISGPADTKPVGADTRIKVPDSSDKKENDED